MGSIQGSLRQLNHALYLVILILQDPNEVSHKETEVDPVVVQNGSFTWDDDSTSSTPILKNINMKVEFSFSQQLEKLLSASVRVSKFG